MLVGKSTIFHISVGTGFELGVNDALDCIASNCVFIEQYCNVLQYVSSSNLIIYYNICHPMVIQCIVMCLDILHLYIT